ncbi:peroxiredoxin-like family protein [Candidatus Albibeggiatoa sp. nov. NOAA]|uniref:peroxiredoxin-like family protein n=1 Tax=Candidatus Albibeggiatoa sp. nov. NOAA TaxID=3162724 RepID=UPI0032F7A34F|nr:AhpC/TSA family protein [Thiotrichaceae bacterium]
MSLQQQLKATHQSFLNDAPEAATLFDQDTEQTIQNEIDKHALKTGDKAPSFTLPDQLGREVSSEQLLNDGVLVVSFYRGGWCPYCNLELRALQTHQNKIKALGANLVAISPQLPDESMSTVEKNALTFTVLSDVDNVIARQFGLVFTLSEKLRPYYQGFGIDLAATNGSDSFELPIPATYVINQDGVIIADYVNADYKQRLEPELILQALVA